MLRARLVILVISVFALTGPWVASAESHPTIDDPYPCLDDEQEAVEEAVDEYKGGVYDCLYESTNLKEARQCWDLDD